jgi:hypothetical protein
LFTFEQLFAADPANPANIAQNAVVTIFEPGDPTQTPLAITDPSGTPLPNPIPVNANGFGPAFAHATLDRVAWAGGGFTAFMTSYEGLKNEAVDARTAAQEAAATAGAEAAVVATAAIGDATADAEAAATSAAAAQAAANASATAAANSAALVGAPADAAIAAAISGSGTATKTALNAGFVSKYYDDGGNYTDRGAIQTIARQVPSPTALQHNIFSMVSGLGDNATFRGVSGGMFQARDLPTVAAGTKGVLYGAQFVVAPAIDRANVPFDDAVGISVENQGTARGTDALYFGHTRGDRGTNPTGQDWGNIIQNDAAAPNFIRTIGSHDIGISLSGATFTTAAIRLGNTHSIAASKADGTLKHLFRLSSGNTLQLAQGTGGIDIRDAFGGIYAQSKIVMPNDTGIFGIRNGVTNEYEMVRITAGDNLALFAARATVLAGGGMLLQNVTSVPSTPVGAGALYVEAGALKFKGTSGTVTTIAPA